MKKEILDLINNIENLLKELKTKVELEKDESKTIVKNENITDNNSSNTLQQLISNPIWYSAVSPDLICDENNHEDKMDRARGIRDIFNPDYDYVNKKVLDFGTGYGHLIQSLTEKEIAFALGYDVKNEFQFQSTKNIVFTSSWEEVIKNAPYDLIFLYDVIDHAVNETPQDILLKVKSVLSDNGIIKMRCHPFISKHGGHVYNKINKAYVHLVFNTDELKEMGHDFKNFPTIKVTMPLKTYNKFIIDVGLKTIDQKVISEPAETFFLHGEIAERIKTNLKINQLLIPQMGMQFVDYTLSK